MSYKKFLIAAATFALCISAASSCKKYYIDDEKINKQIDSLATAGDSLARVVDSLFSISKIESISIVPDDKSDGVIFSMFPFNGKNTDTVRNDITFIVRPANLAEQLVALYNLGDTNVSFRIPLKDVYTKSIYDNELHVHSVEFFEVDSTVIICASGPHLADYTSYGGHYAAQLFIQYKENYAESQFFNLRNDINFQNLWFYTDTDKERWTQLGAIGSVRDTSFEQIFKGVLTLSDSKLSGKFYTGNNWACDPILPSNFKFELSEDTKSFVDGPFDDGTFSFKSSSGYGRYLVTITFTSADYKAIMKVSKFNFVELIQDETTDGWVLWGGESEYPAQRLTEVSEQNFEGFLWMRTPMNGNRASGVFTDWRGNGYYGVYLFDELTGVSATGRRTSGNTIVFNEGPGQYFVKMNVKEGKFGVEKINKVSINGKYDMALDSLDSPLGWAEDGKTAYYRVVAPENIAGGWTFVINDGSFSLGGAPDNLVFGGAGISKAIQKGEMVELWLNRIQSYQKDENDQWIYDRNEGNVWCDIVSE